MILIINTSKEKLHYYEFVKPIEDILKNNNFKFFTKPYLELKESDLKKASKVIITGTSLKDFDYTNNLGLQKFEWIKSYDKPILGICAGMQLIIHHVGGNLRTRKEIGLTKIKFNKDFLGYNGNIEAYELHQTGIGNIRNNFEAYAMSNQGIQAIKHRKREIYGVLFHPEVRNKDLIINFAKL